MPKVRFTQWSVLFLCMASLIFKSDAFAQEGAVQAGQPEADSMTEDKPDLFPIQRYKPTFFLYGSEDSKVQFSFKYRLVKAFDLYYGYTQTLFWNLSADSSPFTDITFNPDLFYDWRINYGVLDSLYMGFIEHTSNGKSGVDSRSHNSSFIQVNTAYTHGPWEFGWNTKFSYFYIVADENKDINRFLGYWQSELSTAYTFDHFVKKAEIYMRFFAGGKSSFNFFKGGQEIGAKMKFNIPEFDGKLFFQYFHGYGDTLLFYSRRESVYRIGIML